MRDTSHRVNITTYSQDVLIAYEMISAVIYLLVIAVLNLSFRVKAALLLKTIGHRPFASQFAL